MKVNSDVHCHCWSRRVVLLSEPSFSNSPPRDQLHGIRLAILGFPRIRTGH
jgi:hypothetical protein